MTATCHLPVVNRAAQQPLDEAASAVARIPGGVSQLLATSSRCTVHSSRPTLLEQLIT
ncbi:hypothetical protein OH768_18155 [Streptomyces sp. NBC_01622]|uniref:hypothetical protein n=1 Tax=Streptomyces sp. NBC_01622 TaxID=2975903 RepID=UPI003867CF87|nr:hypothetical protein OH768_18155 [Streptomyces sp. NBC_01622]